MENKKLRQFLGEWLATVRFQTTKNYSDLELISIGSNLMKDEPITADQKKLAGSAIIDFVQLLMIMKSDQDKMDSTIDFLID